MSKLDFFTLATPVDLETVLKLMPLYYENDHLVFERKKAESAVKAILSNPSLGQIWLCHEKSQIIGYCGVTSGFSLEYGGRVAFVDELFVLEEYRGKGFGSHLLKHVIEESKKNGIKTLRLEVTPQNEKALKLYERLGFENLRRSLLTFEA